MLIEDEPFTIDMDRKKLMPLQDHGSPVDLSQSIPKEGMHVFYLDLGGKQISVEEHKKGEGVAFYFPERAFQEDLSEDRDLVYNYNKNSYEKEWGTELCHKLKGLQLTGAISTIDINDHPYFKELKLDTLPMQCLFDETLDTRYRHLNSDYGTILNLYRMPEEAVKMAPEMVSGKKIVFLKIPIGEDYYANQEKGYHEPKLPNQFKVPKQIITDAELKEIKTPIKNIPTKRLRIH